MKRTVLLVTAVISLFSAAFTGCSKAAVSFFDENIPVTGHSSADTFFRFSQNQLKNIENHSIEYDGTAFEIEIAVKKNSVRKSKKSTLENFTTASSNDSKNILDSLGFLYGEDFSKSGKILKELESRPVVTVDFTNFNGLSFKIILNAKKDRELPKGFFIRTSGGIKYKIKKIDCVAPKVGFDISSRVPVFAFSPNGGRVNCQQIFDRKEFDFSGISDIFPTLNSKDSLLPVLKIKVSTSEEFNSTYKINYGGEKLTIRSKKSDDESSIQTEEIQLSAFQNSFAQFRAEENTEKILSVMVCSNDKKYLDSLEPISADPGLILKWKSKNFRERDFEIFRWSDFPNILFFDTANYAVQDDLFRRLAYFVEKAGYKGTLVSDEILNGKHGYNAHDYRSKDLASFFDTAERENFPLNERELRLKEILLRNEIIFQGSDGKIIEGNGALISISQESTPSLRQVFVAHEGWHGLYFTDEDFRNVTASIYYTADPESIQFLHAYFQATPTLNYDVSDEDLMKNEFMAYMLQRPVNQVRDYFVNMAKREHSQYMIKPEADYIIATDAESFISAADLFDQYVSSRWNLSGGYVGRIR